MKTSTIQPNKIYKVNIISSVVLIVLLNFFTANINAQSLGTGLGYHTTVTKQNGTVYTWGYNGYGQLGNANNTDSSFPVAVDQSSMGALPVELTSFSASVTSSSAVVLNWQTATEVSNYGFEIEKIQK